MFSHIEVHSLRRLQTSLIELDPMYNIVVGENGTGKTTFLEALYLLATGYSFRTRETAPLIQKGKSSLTVFAKTFDHHHVSIQKQLHAGTLVKFEHQLCHHSSELARRFPALVIYPDIFQIIDAGPQVRRQVMDWGMFHVKHSYLNTWQTYRKILKQRNALLKQKAPYALLQPWDEQLQDVANVLDEERQMYTKDFIANVKALLMHLTDLECDITYYKGWDKRGSNKSLQQLLMEHYAADIARQTTHYGAHHADLIIEVKEAHARHGLSRGQQKIILMAMKLAQALTLGRPCLILMDDVTAELDTKHVEKTVSLLKKIKAQYVLTAIKHPEQREHISELIGASANRIDVETMIAQNEVGGL